MILAIDIGNSYLKYKVWKFDQYIISGKMLLGEIDDIQRHLSLYGIEKIYLATVGQTWVEQKIQNLFPKSTIDHVYTKPYCLGVKNGYVTPEKLGVDRWLAIIEAFHLSGKKDCAVFDLGTALTLDVITKDGMHLGGYIAPGLDLMRKSLIGATEKVKFESKDSIEIGYGKNTVDAVENGTFSLIVAWVQIESEIFLNKYDNGVIYMTGGLGDKIIPFLKGIVIYNKDLVLDGIKRISSS